MLSTKNVRNSAVLSMFLPKKEARWVFSLESNTFRARSSLAHIVLHRMCAEWSILRGYCEKCRIAHFSEHLYCDFTHTAVSAKNLCTLVFPFEIMVLALSQDASSQFYPQKMWGNAQAWQAGDWRHLGAHVCQLASAAGTKPDPMRTIKRGIGMPSRGRRGRHATLVGAPGRVRSASPGNGCACLKRRRDK